VRARSFRTEILQDDEGLGGFFQTDPLPANYRRGYKEKDRGNASRLPCPSEIGTGLHGNSFSRATGDGPARIKPGAAS
jgi:hypothetical protein